MAGQMPKLVNKQFNSPIGLYSEQNVREILDRETQMLANGAIGINFHNPVGSKPANLHNSAVLRMLEEEESKQRNGVKRVAWPPPREADGEFSEQSPVESQGGAQYSTQTPGLQSQSPNNNQQAPVVGSIHPRPVTPLNRSATPQSPIKNNPVSPVFNQRPANFGAVQKPWAPVQSPTSPQTPSKPQGFQQQPREFQIPIQIESYKTPQPDNQPKQFTSSIHQQFSTPVQQQKPLAQQNPPPQQQYTPLVQQQFSPPVSAVPQSHQQPQYQPAAPKQFEPPPTTITLRPKVPTSQAPAPVFTSQPATATFRGGKHLRGDMKWPPEDVKEKMDAENQARVELAKGPAFRPRRVAKDYSSFFAQHALNSTYPGYKVPPGTQYYDHHPVM